MREIVTSQKIHGRLRSPETRTVTSAWSAPHVRLDIRGRRRRGEQPEICAHLYRTGAMTVAKFMQPGTAVQAPSRRSFRPGFHGVQARGHGCAMRARECLFAELDLDELVQPLARASSPERNSSRLPMASSSSSGAHRGGLRAPGTGPEAGPIPRGRRAPRRCRTRGATLRSRRTWSGR